MTRRAAQPALPLNIPAMPAAVRAELRTQITPDWGQQAACASQRVDPDWWFTPADDPTQTAARTSAAPARSAGPAWLTPWSVNEPDGIWGGFDDSERAWLRLALAEGTRVASGARPVHPDGGGLMSLAVLASITTEMAREMAVSNGVCIRPIMKRVYDRDTGSESRVPIACGSTREAVCPPCARKARVLRMQQCQRAGTATPNPTAGRQLDQADNDAGRRGRRGSAEGVSAGAVDPAAVGCG